MRKSMNNETQEILIKIKAIIDGYKEDERARELYYRFEELETFLLTLE